jgi:hypothetical protein
MRKLIIFSTIIGLFSAGFAAERSKTVKFTGDKVGAAPKSFSSFVGSWYVTKDGESNVYAVDGRKWSQGTMSAGIADKAKALYGERYAEFLDNLAAYKYFPLSIYQGVKNFTDGTISVRFKTVSGRIDQAAGIAFDIKPNGDYFVIRANPLENNIVAFRLQHGKRSAVKWIRNIPTPSNKWHTLKLIIKGNVVIGFLNGKKCITIKTDKKIEGKIGLWSKADSYVLFDDFIYQK